MTNPLESELPSVSPLQENHLLKAMRILLIEDDPIFAASLSRLLASAGYETSLCHNGREGLARLAEEEHDLCLVDINLPDMLGHTLIQAMRAHGFDTASIVVSGESEIETAIQALRAGALDFVRKPIEPAILLHSVRRALHQRSVEREHAEFQQRISRSERLHRFLVGQSPDLIFILDADGNITYINDRLHALLGMEQERTLGKHFSRLMYAHERNRARYAFGRSKIASTARHEVEFRLRSQLDVSGYRHFRISIAAVGLPGEMHEADEPEHDPIHYYGIARDITSQREMEAWASYQANHDSLTNLPNRNLFRDRLGLALDHARRNDSRLAVLFLNLDRFKAVNDQHGHANADELLRQVAERMQHCLRGGDTLARFGGYEFLLLNTDVQTQQDVLGIVNRINNEFARPFRVDGSKVVLSLSAGIALYPEHGESADDLVRHANIALYHGRLSSSNGHTFFMPEMGASVDHRLSLESELHQALANQEFEVYYQPQLLVEGRRVKSVEALIRWHHPRLGLLPPSEFLHIAEETGQIVAIGEWVTEQVCRDIHRWDQIGVAIEQVAINISPRHLDQQDFVERFINILEVYDVDAGRIEAELTENLFIRDPGIVAGKLQSLAAYGVSIAIDDFGTQYSSLSYLQKFPIHTLKIDKTFVWEIDRGFRQHAIIKAIISIAHSLGLNLIAEGVETDEQMKFLEAQGCNEIQGYLISKPLARDHLEKLLHDGLTGGA
jgi:diguanylate cyclase (GGDEF)-like protein/PAS domain S-box-containing protein